MQVGMLATFRVPEDRPTFVADLVGRWRETKEFAPPFNYLYKSLPVPSWVELESDQIDLDYHLRHSALPAPGSQRELGVLVSRLHSSMLDRRYPLWECHVIEGLEEDRWSLYIKAHHSQVDGVGGIRLLRRILSVDPDARDMMPPWAIGTRGTDQSGVLREARQEVEPEATGLGDRLRGGVLSSIAVAGSLARTYTESFTGMGADEDRAVPYRAPKSIFNGRIHTPRRFATQHYSIERLRARGQGSRRQPERRLPHPLRWSATPLPGRAGRDAERRPHGQRAGLGAAGGTRCERRQRDHVPLCTAASRSCRPGRADRGDQGLDEAGQGAAPRGRVRGDGRLHRRTDAALHRPGGARHGRPRSPGIQPGDLQRPRTGRDALPGRVADGGDLPGQPALQRTGPEHHGGLLRRRVQHRLHRLPRLDPPPAADRRLLR